jgi:hypothetical protein
MWRFGGLYSDVKPPPKMIAFSLWRFFKTAHWFAGHGERDIGGISTQSSLEVRENWKRLAANGYFAFAPRSEFAEEWVKRVRTKMDYHLEELERWGHENTGRGPVLEDDIFEGYPIRWAELQGELFHQLQFEFCFPAKLWLPRPSSRPYL